LQTRQKTGMLPHPWGKATKGRTGTQQLRIKKIVLWDPGEVCSIGKNQGKHHRGKWNCLKRENSSKSLRGRRAHRDPGGGEGCFDMKTSVHENKVFPFKKARTQRMKLTARSRSPRGEGDNDVKKKGEKAESSLSSRRGGDRGALSVQRRVSR